MSYASPHILARENRKGESDLRDTQSHAMMFMVAITQHAPIAQW